MTTRVQRSAALSLGGFVAVASGFAAVAQAAPWTETILHSFNYSDGASPRAGLVLAADGTFYGTTYDGGPGGFGELFALSGGTLTVLHGFNSTDGRNPAASPTLAPGGVVYGTTPHGGDFSRSVDGYGTVFSFAASGFKVLHTFTNGTDGGAPFSPLLLNPDGTLSGTTYYGGNSFAGIVFNITPGGTLTTLHLFSNTVGSSPEGGLARVPGGSTLYGTTVYYGGKDAGSVFSIKPDGTFFTLHRFTGSPDGGNPEAAVLATARGLVGTTSAGGVSGNGALFALGADGSYKVLYSFTCSADGGTPTGSLVADAARNLYGTTSACGRGGFGTVFRFTPGTGMLTTLHAFEGNARDGGVPLGALVLDAGGNLYGTARDDGPGGSGVIYELSPPGS